MFSTITIDASVSIPIAIAIPPSDMRFADIPVTPMHITAMRAHIGSDNATMKALLRFPRNSRRIRITRIPPSSSAFFTSVGCLFDKRVLAVIGNKIYPFG